jgi:hypothetical protein
MLRSSTTFADGITIPFDFGLPQFFILLVGLGGLALLVHVLLRLTRGKPDPVKGIRIRRFHYGRAMSGMVLLFLSISLIYLAILLQTYFGLTSRHLVARVHAAPIANQQHQMSVDLILFDKHGNKASEQTYAICGDRWLLQGDIVKFADWTAILGLHTGYKLTRLEGQYDDINLERTAQHCAQELNGGDDNFFQTLQHQGGWLHPVVESSYGNALILPADGSTYNVYVSQTGLFAGAPESLFPLSFSEQG